MTSGSHAAHRATSRASRSTTRVRPIAKLALAATTAFGTLLALVSVLGPGAASASAIKNLRHPRCGVTSKLAPHCGRWWGVSPLPYQNKPLRTSLPQEENYAGRNLDIVHTYHTNGQLFPNAAERAVGEQRGHNRLLLINWKPATDMSWRQVAQGKADARIDREASYIKHNFRHHFFLAIWHEPENDVNPHKGSGRTAADYSAMYRHVVRRLRARNHVSWLVTVMNYMGFDNWARKSWFHQLWPGNHFVDWSGIDPYGTGAKSSWTARTFSTLVNRRDGKFPGFYSWLHKAHPHKPIMLCEWGVDAKSNNPGGQAAFFRSVRKQLRHYPQIKALVYFDMPKPPGGQPRTFLAAASSSLTAYRALGRSALIVGPRIHYAH